MPAAPAPSASIATNGSAMRVSIEPKFEMVAAPTTRARSPASRALGAPSGVTGAPGASSAGAREGDSTERMPRSEPRPALPARAHAPISRSTSAVCSPSRGARREIRHAPFCSAYGAPG